MLQCLCPQGGDAGSLVRYELVWRNQRVPRGHEAGFSVAGTAQNPPKLWSCNTSENGRGDGKRLEYG